MAIARQTYEEFSDMPAGLRDFLLSDDFTRLNDELQKAYALKDEQKNLIGDKMLDAAFGDVELPQAVADLKQALVPSSIPEEKWTAFLADFLKAHAWPLRELYGDELTGVLRASGIGTAGWPASRVIMKPLTYSGAASEIASMVGFSLMGQQTRERLRDLVMSKAKGIRIDAQVRETLMRGSDFGGLGLDAQMADRTIEAMNRLLSSTQIMSEEEYAGWLAEASRKKAESFAAPAPQSLGAVEDDAEIERIKQKMPTPAVPASTLDKAVEEIFAGLAVKPADEYLAKRLRYIISSRLRDVRSPLELKQLLQRDTKVGGMGIERDAADPLAAQIEEGYKKFHQPIMEEEKTKLDRQLEEQKIKIEDRRKREAEEHAKWYREKVLARKQEEDQRKEIAERMKQSFAAVGLTTPIAAHPIDEKEKRVETQRFGELVPAVAAGAAPLAPPTAPSAQAVAPPVPAPAPVPSPPVAQAARPEVKVSKATVELQQAAAGMKPRMEDVKATPRHLMGPVEELRGLTLAEFRRLAKDPAVAAQKIIQRIDVMGQESFERRLDGIKAWQTCPLQGSYMQLVSESFKAGVPVVQLAEEQRKAGKDVPSPAEISAIISLNSKLHF